MVILPIENCDFTHWKWWLPIENGDYPLKIVILPIENDSPLKITIENYWLLPSSSD